MANALFVYSHGVRSTLMQSQWRCIFCMILPFDKLTHNKRSIRVQFIYDLIPWRNSVHVGALLEPIQWHRMRYVWGHRKILYSQLLRSFWFGPAVWHASHDGIYSGDFQVFHTPVGRFVSTSEPFVSSGGQQWQFVVVGDDDDNRTSDSSEHTIATQCLIRIFVHAAYESIRKSIRMASDCIPDPVTHVIKYRCVWLAQESHEKNVGIICN